MTEGAYFGTAAEKECFEELGVEKYEIIATLDSRTSKICRSLDGKRLPVKEFRVGVTAPPFHPWCRSTVCPCFDDFKESAGDGERNRIPEGMSYEEWKEKFVDGEDKEGLAAIDKYGNGGIIEQERMQSSSDYAVPKDLTSTREFRAKFDSMDSDKKLQREYYQNAKEMLKHRSGTNGEDLYYYNPRLKKWYKSTSGTQAGTPDYTDEIVQGLIESKTGEIISFHNHPLGMPPSVSDLNAALVNGYKKGYTIRHNGKIFEYTPPKYKIDKTIYDKRIEKYKKEGFDEFQAQLKSLEDLSELYGFFVREVK